METTPNAHDQIAQNLLPSTLTAVAEFQTRLDATFEGEERQRVEDALWLMCEVHADQKARPDGTPYVEHPLDVARNVLQASYTADSDEIIAALLHDSAEDQAQKLAAKAIDAGVVGNDERSLALGYIQSQYGGRVAHIVSELTNPDFEAELRMQGQAVTTEAKNRLYAEHVRAAIQDPDVLPIKLFDFAANALRLDGVTDPARRLKLTRKYAPVVDVFIKRLTDGHPTGINSAVQSQLVVDLMQARANMEPWLHDQA